MRARFNAPRWIARVGAPWLLLPNNFPPWEVVYQQNQSWLQAGYFDAMINDLRSFLRVAQGKKGQPNAFIRHGRTLQSTCESGPRAGHGGYKRKKGSRAQMDVDTLMSASRKVDPSMIIGVRSVCIAWTGYVAACPTFGCLNSMLSLASSVWRCR
ncbi:transposase [Xanthomonas campestris pv. campestris]|nr:transposase [Xanthomonas campestris pv. campestris]